MCTQSASSVVPDEPGSTASWPESDSPESSAIERASAGTSSAVRSSSQARKRNAATNAKPRVMTMNALPNRVPCAIGVRSP